MRKFWIDVRKEGDGVKIEVGKGTEIRGFMSRSWDSIGYNSFPPTHVAFSAWNNKIDFKFCLNEPGKGRLKIFLFRLFCDCNQK